MRPPVVNDREFESIAGFHLSTHSRSPHPVPRLGINVDHVATLRQARGGSEPDPVAAALLAELAGADAIVVHLREDRRHIQDRDLALLRQTVKTRLDLEMAADDAMVKNALAVRPDYVTLVPERRQELTTEGGLDVIGHRNRIKKIVAMLRDGGIPVSLFIEPDADQIKASKTAGAEWIELHTGRYANAQSDRQIEAEFQALATAARLAAKLKLRVNAGHGLNYRNVPRLTTVAEIEEYNIGHSIVARAVLVGMEQAVREMKQLLSRSPGPLPARSGAVR
jgi:pyridoxine 5-phosphate synthase